MDAKQQKRYNDIPELYKANYKKAIEQNSKAAALKAKCMDCCCWQRKEVTLCVATDCPLHKYRPYQAEKPCSPQ